MSGSDEESSVRRSGSSSRRTRRLHDYVQKAFRHACDQRDTEAARYLLDVLEFMAGRARRTPDGVELRAQESLVAAHERLWHIQHPSAPR